MKLAAPRLLPIVIAATAALLLFKGIGLVTSGGYTLVGMAPAVAEGSGGGTASAGGEAVMGGPNMADSSPTLEDPAVTMELPSSAGPADGAHGASSEPGPGPADAAANCPPDAVANGAGAEAGQPVGPCLPDPGVNEYGDALPLIKDNASGAMVPLADVAQDGSSEGALTDRLSQRRADLERREKELEMRTALIDAAEKRIEQRSAELKALEEKISKLVDDKEKAEQQQFVSLVAMYENMKPKDAATIFDQLDMPVLLGVAKAMNPRKMAPILARMSPLKAKALTDGIAAGEVPAVTAATAAAEDLTNLPQIVGQ